ncbi:ComF family protein [Paenibacillus xerothermodurans]|uniref:ComF family protein n=1 Tax=Paenibacillus xerothermodurans TaxID=1977292 RepID=A0A2W1NUS1_PAEXE|nr:ComF family protein [Paenibacillus xerothermodurans]PZE19432.1 ComF family protein [Paenibacillus xerothermodurans]
MKKRSGIGEWIKQWVDKAERLLAPTWNTCSACGVSYSTEHALPVCKRCSEVIPWILNVRCDQCGRSEVCLDCTRRKQRFFVRNRSVVRYSPDMKEWLGLYKYRGNENMQRLMGTMLLHAYNLHNESAATSGDFSRCVELITYVPLSDTRLAERGFNQAQQLAQELGRHTGIPVISMLERVRHTDKQSFKTRAGRLQDMQGVFAVLPSAKVKYNDLFSHGSVKLYIVDDVYTTGSTLNECSKAIKKELPADVFGISWAR